MKRKCLLFANKGSCKNKCCYDCENKEKCTRKSKCFNTPEKCRQVKGEF